MIDNWLSYTDTPKTHGLYKHIDVVEITTPDLSVKEYLGKEILSSYRDLDFVKLMFETRPEAELRAYIRNYVLASDKNQFGKNVGQGDFAEILAGLIVSFFQHLTVPIRKMQWKFNKDKSVFSTDMVAHNSADPLTDFFYYEIKSKITHGRSNVNGLSAYVTVHAYNSLEKESKVPKESIADFLARLYHKNGDMANAKKYFDVVLDPSKYNSNYELFFIIDADKFDQAIIDDLLAIPPTLGPLCVTLVLIKNLGKLILDVRDMVTEAAIKKVYPTRI